ncbi:uncharacterized protein LOC114580564 [Dendrobium catenatum]|uniref:uncharacterized protein LOC114580564 n=1 Tax=Dendrobium catenatum TaxID=906689 RepID=UPI00109FFB1D|nr:uncharacterized protein LOC114580564 [Dendrobium catenatum]
MGQRINCTKSAILFSKNCPGWKQRRIANLPNFRRVQSLEYLGLQLAMRKLVAFDFPKVVKNAMGKINSWGRRHLSLAGHATLIHTFLLAVPMYLMTHTTLPRSILVAIECMARRFLWQKDNASRGIHYVRWEELCHSTASGGLGFHASADWAGPLRARLAWDIIGNLTLARWPTFFKVEALDGQTVSCLLDEHHNWNRDTIRDCLGEELANRVLNVQISTGDGSDSPELLHSHLAVTITSMAYNHGKVKAGFQFAWLRRLKLHPREQFFWWRLFQDALPTMEWLFRRGLSDSRNCPWGCPQLETLEHVAAHCDNLAASLSVLAKWGFHMPPVNSWIKLLRMLELAARDNASHGRLYCYTFWSNGVPLSPLDCLPTSFGAPPPPPGWVKFNVDASLQPSGTAGLGIVARDVNGRLVVAVGKQIEHWDVTNVEIMAALAVKDAIRDWMMQMDGIIIEGDCLPAIKWLQTMFNYKSKDH